MKSEPPTPTRATPDQFRKIQDQLNYSRNTSLLTKYGVGVGVPTPSATVASCGKRCFIIWTMRVLGKAEVGTIQICIYIYIYMRKANCGAQIFDISYDKTCVSPRRDAQCQQVCCFIEGKHNFSKQAFLLGHMHVFKFMRCFAMAKQLSACTC